MTTILRPPYTLNYTQGSGYLTADRNSGRLWSLQSLSFLGSSQAIAQVGSAFQGPAGTRRIRVEATVLVNHYSAFTPAFFGYASAESIINLRVMDGSRVVALDRRSLARAIAAVFWMTDLRGGPFTIAMATEFWGGGGRQYSAHVDVETWVGAGGIGAGAVASGSAVAQEIRVRVI
ncbi:hypothetical protein GA707_03530 [Nostocoides sp. F2B08]|uniref:hypothetical protein n=1 Tax=Nostocoides sp. F2B08 TaxID=2653936 RepID=UPI0012636E03|nr:hypothetical protein [Tetrasphaera sp. F2B08]KAB7746567.1 hypothetical protein GA707_03530 [Tetrasphaera sp. F2B08]